MKEFKCKIDGCAAQFHKAKGYCVHHYLKAKYEPSRRKAKQASSQTLCQFEGQHSNVMCIAQIEGKSCCTKHYADRMGLQ